MENMSKTKTLEERVGLIKGWFRRLNLDKEIVYVKPASNHVEGLFKDDEILRGLESMRKELKTRDHEVKASEIMAFLSQVHDYGFLEQDVNYVDWCCGRGMLAYSIAHLVGAQGFRVDKRFSRKNVFQEKFPCTKKYNIPAIKLDLTALRDDEEVQQIPTNPDGRSAYLGLRCCGSTPDLIVRYGDLQSKKPDLIAIIPCCYEKMDFVLSMLGSRIMLEETTFLAVTRAAAYLKRDDGHRDVARRAMAIIDHFRVENLKLLGYDARVVKVYHPNVSPFNHMIIGVKN